MRQEVIRGLAGEVLWSFVSTLTNLPKRLLVGRPLSTGRLGETFLSKRLALPIFCSDALSSNAYATEEILLVLSVGGLALLSMTPWIAGAVIVLLLVVIASYRQTCYAYPSGGGAYAVSKANLGQNAALIAAGALMIDYVMTVAVSIASGIYNLVSAVPELAPQTLNLCLAAVAVITLANLRGLRESGTMFAIPTYGFIIVIFATLGIGLFRAASGGTVVAESASITVESTSGTIAGFALVAVLLRAFASGCTALTGVEAVSNGVPNFKPPKSRNASRTLATMAVLTVVMLAGIALLAMITRIHLADDPELLVNAPAGYQQRSVIAQLAGAVFGIGSPAFYLVQGFTTLILVIAANTAFNGFPILASILGRDGYLPRQLSRRGDRLVFSNGIIILAGFAGVLLIAFDASTTRLMQLYILGVFVSFTLSQVGMVRHWTDRLRLDVDDRRERRRIHRARAINGFGAVLTALVLVVVLATKFTHGAWIVVIALPALFVLMRGIRGHYDRVSREVAPTPEGVPLPSRIHAVVLISRLSTPALRAVAFARATRPSTLVALTVQTDAEANQRLMDEWAARGVPVPLTVLASPFRDITRPIIEYIAEIRRNSPRDVVVVFIPEYVVDHWWEQLLHNQSALRLKTRLLFQPGVMMTSVPWRLDHEGVLERRAAGGGGSAWRGARGRGGAAVRDAARSDGARSDGAPSDGAPSDGPEGDRGDLASTRAGGGR
jgi:amino acid transporter